MLKDPNQHYTDLVQVGKGSTGLVYQGLAKETGKKFAIKKFDLSKLTDIPALENEVRYPGFTQLYADCRCLTSAICVCPFFLCLAGDRFR